MAESRKDQIMAHLSASTSANLEVPEIAQNPGWLAPQAMCDDKTYSRRMEHVARSLGNFYNTSPTSAQIIEHINMTTAN